MKKWFVCTQKRSTISGHALKVFVHNVKLISIPADYELIDNKIISNDIKRFAETQNNALDSIFKIMETLNFFNIDLKQ